MNHWRHDLSRLSTFLLFIRRYFERISYDLDINIRMNATHANFFCTPTTKNPKLLEQIFVLSDDLRVF